MKLKNKVLNRSKILMIIVAVILAAFWGVIYSGIISEDEKGFRILIIVMTVWAVLFIIPVFFTQLFSKGFNTYYETLLPLEKQRFDEELANVKPKQNLIMTSKAIVYIDFIVITAYAYENIRSMKKQGRTIVLYGENGALGALRASSDANAEQLMQEIWKHNAKIEQEY